MKNIAVLLIIAAALFAQTEKKLAFEVVSIKPNNSGDSRQRLGSLDPAGRYSAMNIDLRYLIAVAYGDPSPQNLGDNTEITGLPDWARTARFDVEAQPPAGSVPTAPQRQQMLQSMLEGRFQLKIRVEPEERPIYALVVDNAGVKMKPYVAPAPGAPQAAPPKALVVPKGGLRFRLNASMTTIATFLTSNAGRKVVDKTGLGGLYEFDLTWTPDPAQVRPGAEVDPDVPSLFTALREQLGLRLVAETGLVDTFVVESVQRPSAN